MSDLLNRRAGAVMHDDAAGFDATMGAASASFRASSRAWFARIRTLPLASYSIVPDADGYEDLVGALARRPPADEVHVVPAVQRLAFAAYDASPAASELYLTVIRRGSRWSVVSDSDLDDLGLQSAKDLWDFGSIRAVKTEDVLVITRGDTASARRIATAAHNALVYDRAHWPYPFHRRVVVEIGRTAAELQRIFEDPADLGLFVAITSGTRVFIQPATFFGYSSAYRADTLSHEVIHYATRTLSGWFTPVWLEEGVAQRYGERRAQPHSYLAAATRRGAITGVPADHDFGIGGHDPIHAAYEAAYSFVTYLDARFGSTAGARFYKALGTESAVSAGTRRYHANRAAQASFRASFDALERDWLSRIQKEYG